MSDEREQHRREALEKLGSCVETMEQYLDFVTTEGDDGEVGDAYEDGPEDLGPVAEWGLEWGRHSADFRNGTVTYVHVLATGGPHYEFQVAFGEDQAVEEVTFVYLPWFGRVEVGDFGSRRGPEDLTMTKWQAVVVRRFYELFWSDWVDAEVLDDGS